MLNSSSYQIIALNTADGQLAWQTSLDKGVQSHLVTANGQVFLIIGEASVGGGTLPRLISLNATTGNLLWGRDLATSQAGTFPRMPAIDGNLAHLVWEYKSGATHQVRWSIFNATNGSLIGETAVSTATNATNPCIPLSPPVTGGGRGYVAIECEGYKIAAVNLNNPSVMWQVSYTPRDSSTEALAYTLNPARLLVAEPTGIRALDPANGQIIWNWLAGATVRTAPTAAGDSLWVATGETNNWHWHVLSVSNGQEGIVWPMMGDIPEAYPVLAGELMLYSTSNGQWLFATGGGQATDWFEQAITFVSEEEEENEELYLPIIMKNSS